MQCDISSGNLSTILSTYKPIGANSGDFKRMKLASDGKIYFAGRLGIYLDAIINPDADGVNAGWQADVIQLAAGANTTLGLPTSVPVFRRDTVTHDLLITLDCFSSWPELMPYDTSGWDYTWNDGSTARHRTITQPGIYWVKYFLPSCTYVTDTFHVVLKTGPLPEVHSSLSCKNTPSGKAWVFFDASDTTSYRIAWSSPSDAAILSATDSLLHVPGGNYQVRIIAPDGCDTTIPVTIDTDNYTVAFATDSLLCEKQAYTFQNTSTGNITAWQWDFGDGGTSSLQHPEHSYAIPGSFRITLIASNNTPCTDTFYRDVIVDTLPTLSISKDKDEICSGEGITFYPSASTGLASLSWDFGDGRSEEQAISGITHLYENPGAYPVILAGHFRACPDTTVSDTIYVAPLPEVSLGPDTAICPGDAIRLANLEAGKEGDQYRWSTGAATATIPVQEPGEYWLQVISAHECTATDSITIHRSCYIDLPNVFTPNGDGVNDYFFPRGLLTRGVTNFHMQIFNRWGQIVYESRNLTDRGWDGRFNGDPVQEGVYVYHVSAGFRNGGVERYQGNVTLLR